MCDVSMPLFCLVWMNHV
uniref:Uncharacterized protein n=1 Tax=Arundo donax TaxID=35708 RepID=A0A0A8Z4T7_ARUDO